MAFVVVGHSYFDRIVVELFALLVKLGQVMAVLVHSYFGLQLELEFGRIYSIEQAALLE